VPEVNRTKIIRPEKINVNLYTAWTIKELSCDGQTKHGCTITDKNNRPLGWGYNSFPRDCDNDALPNLRADGSTDGIMGCKYPWMVHAERNAVTNCTLKPVGGIAYVTGLCCFDCTVHLWQNGINMIYQLDRTSPCGEKFNGGKDEELKRELLEHVGRVRADSTETLSIVTVKADFTFSLGIQAEANRLGLIHRERERFGRCVEDVG
jgi:deoxycytidylate deaminase